MAQSLQSVWQAAAADPFVPTIGKDSQFSLGFSLLTIGILLSGYFGLSEHSQRDSHVCCAELNSFTDRSLLNVPLVGIPASLAIGFGAVYMICAVGVYV